MQPVATSHIELRPNRDGQMRAFIAGTRVRVQDIVSDHERHGFSPEEIAREYPHLTLGQVYSALAYYFDHRQDVQDAMRADERYADDEEARQAASTAKPTAGEHANDHSVSP